MNHIKHALTLFIMVFWTLCMEATPGPWTGILSVENQNLVVLFNTDTGAITSTIALPTASLGSIMTLDGTTVYAFDATAPNVYVIDVATSSITGTIALPAEVGSGGFDIIINPAGTKLYMSNNVSGYVTVLDIATNTVDADILVGPNLGSLSITPDGKTVYVANFSFSPNNVTTIDTATNTVGVNITTGFAPGLFSITPDGTKGFVGNSLSDTVSVVDIATNTVINTIAFPAGSGPYGSSILPNGQTVYVANIYNSTVTVIDVASETIVTVIPVPGTGPFWIAATPDSKTVFVANLNTSDVTPIDVATNTAGSTIAAVPGVLQDISMSADPAPTASFFATGTVIGSPTVFDASASFSPIGTIATYTWDFGDGTIVSTPNPIIAHNYATENVFNVTLTVTNTAGTSTTKVFSSRFMSNNGGPSAMIVKTVAISPSSPTNLKGTQICYICCSNKRFVNVISWNPPIENIMPAYYVIYSDAALTHSLGVVYGNMPLQFEDCAKKGKTYTYYVVAVSTFGTVSSPASVTVLPTKCRPCR